MKIFILSFVLFLNCTGISAREWSDDNFPWWLGYIHNFKYDGSPKKEVLNLSGGKPWSGYFWPIKEGGIGHISKGKKLSPIDKWEKGNPDTNAFDLRAYSDNVQGKNQGASDAGYCDGYSATSFLFEEPIGKTVNGVHFTASEIKAYLAVYYDDQIKQKKAPTNYIGLSCRNFKTKGRSSDKACEDLNPGSMHLALFNNLHYSQNGFAMDMDPGEEIWNVPVYGYEVTSEREYKGPNLASQSINAVKVLHLNTSIFYLHYQYPIFDNDELGSKGQIKRKMDVEYTLEINSIGEIIGGEWLSENHPDFFWKTQSLPKPSGKWKFLNKLLR